jgi:oligosaccharide repeat unit polymerase
MSPVLRQRATPTSPIPIIPAPKAPGPPTGPIQQFDEAPAPKPEPTEAKPAGVVPVVVALTVALITVWALIDLLARGHAAWLTGAGQLMAAILTVVVALRLIGLVLQPAFDFPRALFYTFTLVWMCLAPLAQLSLRIVPIPIELSPERYETAIILTVLGIIGYELGVTAMSRRNTARAARPARSDWRLNPRNLIALTLGGIPLVVALLTYVGGVQLLLTSRMQLSDAIFGVGTTGKASGAIVNAAILVIPFVTALGWVIVLTSGRKLKGHEKFLAFVAIVFNLMVNNPVVQSRFWVATVFLSLLGSWLTPRFPQFPRVAVALSLAFLVVVFPFSDVFRYADQSRTLKIEDPLSQLATKGDFDAFPQLTSALRHEELFGLRDGQQILGATFFFVPRAYWPTKAEDTGTMLGKENTLGNVNLSAPLWAEGYIDFGWIGTFVYLFGLGVLSVSLNFLLRAKALGAGFASFIGVYQFVLLRGSLLQAMGITFVLVFLFRFLLTRKRLEPGDVTAGAGPAGR